MFVRNHLIPASSVVTVLDTDSLNQALVAMEANGHDALPVLNSAGALTGLLSKQHVYKTFFMQGGDKEVFINTTLVKQLMKTDFKRVYEADLIEAAIRHMTSMRMQFIVVFNDKDKFSGILTRRNLLEAMANALGMDKKGVRVEVLASDLQGRLASMTKVLAKYGYNIRSIFMYDPQVMNLQKIVLRVDARNEQHVVDILNDAGFKVLTSLLE